LAQKFVSGWLLGLLLTLAGIFLTVGAFYYLTAAGDENKLKKAKNYIIYTVVAVAVGLLSKLLVTVVKGLLGAS